MEWMNMTSKPNTRLILVAIVVIGLGAMCGISMLFDTMPSEYGITTTSGEVVISGSVIPSAEGLILTLDYQALDAAGNNICNLWDIEEGQTVEVGAFSVNEWGAGVWAFSLDNVRNGTHSYKLVLAGDLSGETFVFNIDGGGVESTTDTTTTTTTDTGTTTTTDTTTTTTPITTPPPDEEDVYYNVVVMLAMGFLVVGTALICFRRK
jgi:hypothetical protein